MITNWNVLIDGSFFFQIEITSIPHDSNDYLLILSGMIPPLFYIYIYNVFQSTQFNRPLEIPIIFNYHVVIDHIYDQPALSTKNAINLPTPCIVLLFMCPNS